MGKIEGTVSGEIEAPIERCYEQAADVDRIHEWQGGVQQVQVLERDAQGRAAVATITTQTKVRAISTTLRFAYDPPNRVSWKQTKGDLKTFDGYWSFAPAGNGRTAVTYSLDGDPGRMLGMLLRGPVEEKLRDLLVTARPGELKRRAETG